MKDNEAKLQQMLNDLKVKAIHNIKSINTFSYLVDNELDKHFVIIQIQVFLYKIHFTNKDIKRINKKLETSTITLEEKTELEEKVKKQTLLIQHCEERIIELNKQIGDNLKPT